MSTPSQHCSVDAVLSVDVASQEATVLTYINSCGDDGSTSDQCEDFLGLPHQSVSMRFCALKRHGRIFSNGTTRKTRAGRNACVWYAFQ